MTVIEHESFFERFFKRIGLIDEFDLSFKIEQREFVRILGENIERSGLGLFSDMADGFSSSPHTYKGELTENGFRIKRRRRRFERNMNAAIATGKYSGLRGSLNIHLRISSVEGPGKFAFFFLLFTYVLFLVVFLANASQVPLFAFGFIILHGIIMFGVFYFVFRSSVRRMKRELEKEFIYMISLDQTGRSSSGL